MLTLQSDVTQYAIVPLTFTDQNGARQLPAGSLKANVVSGEGATAEIIETASEGSLAFSLKLVPGPTAGTYKFSVTDNTPEGDNLRINQLDVDYISTSESVVDIVAGTPELRPKSELPPVTP